MLARASAVFAIALGLGGRARATTTNVTTAPELRAAFAAAQPGTTIHLAPGAYALDTSLTTMAAGTAAQPIKLTSDQASAVRLDFSSTEGLVVGHAYWVIEGVWLNGTCAGCDAIGVRALPATDHLTVHAARITNFAIGIKGERAGDAEPSDGTIDSNELYNTSQLASGGTPIDLIGGKRWHIVGNYLHDFSGTGKHAGISVAGGAADALIERNLIVGNKDQPVAGSSQGLSLGGGDTPPAACAAANRGPASCACEVLAGRVQNNIVVRTIRDGVLLGRACGTSVLLNTVYLTVPGLAVVTPGPSGILDVRFNFMSGAIIGTSVTLNKAGAAAVSFKNCYKDPDGLDFSTGPSDALINDLQPAIAEVTDDYLGDPRNVTLDYGAVELKVGTRATWPWAGAALIGAGTVPPSAPTDAGIMVVDAATDGAGPAGAGGGAAGGGGSVVDGSGAAAGGQSGGGTPVAPGGGQGGAGTGGANGVAPAGASGGCACATADANGGGAGVGYLLGVLLALHARCRDARTRAPSGRSARTSSARRRGESPARRG